MRKFGTGATRDSEDGKLDYEGFYSPLVMKRYAEYMHKNRMQADGKLRDSDNWQKGIPKDAYMKSAWRHFYDWWAAHRSGKVDEEAMCALMFNVMGYMHEHLNDMRKSKEYLNEKYLNFVLAQLESACDIPLGRVVARYSSGGKDWKGVVGGPKDTASLA